jgi:hypothetical protein
MVVRVTNNFRIAHNGRRPLQGTFAERLEALNVLPLNAKMLAWAIFLYFFIENGTLGLIPKSYYFVYRNVRVSDLIMYGMVIYSLFNLKEFIELYKSPSAILVKLLFIYLFAQFIVSVILYQQNVLEYFFRLKGVWSSLLIFPYLLLLKRNAFNYLVKIILPVAIVSNILYILSALTGIALMPEISIEKTNLPGGLQVNRVYGGTFFGEFLFLGFVYNWIVTKIRLYQVVLAVLFIVPHILAFGRSAWMFFVFSIILMLVWNSLRKREFKIVVKQAVLIVLLVGLIMYAFAQFLPESDRLAESIEARVIQGQEDVENKSGTYGTRLANIAALVDLWQKSNLIFGVGMHPMWVIKPTTTEELIYIWGFSDVRWAGVLAAYGLVGFLMAIAFQIYYMYKSVYIIKKTKSNSVYTFLVLLLLAYLLFDSFINYSYNLFSVRLWGISDTFSFFMAALIYKSVYIDA